MESCVVDPRGIGTPGLADVEAVCAERIPRLDEFVGRDEHLNRRIGCNINAVADGVDRRHGQLRDRGRRDHCLCRGDLVGRQRIGQDCVDDRAGAKNVPAVHFGNIHVGVDDAFPVVCLARFDLIVGYFDLLRNQRAVRLDIDSVIIPILALDDQIPQRRGGQKRARRHEPVDVELVCRTHSKYQFVGNQVFDGREVDSRVVRVNLDEIAQHCRQLVGLDVVRGDVPHQQRHNVCHRRIE